MIEKSTYQVYRFQIWIFIVAMGMTLSTIHAANDDHMQLSLIGHYEIPEANFVTDV